MNIGETFTFVFGMSVTGAGSALFITAAYLMARHATLLFAGVRMPVKDTSPASGISTRFSYRTSRTSPIQDRWSCESSPADPAIAWSWTTSASTQVRSGSTSSR